MVKCLGNSSVVMRYIIRPKLGPVAKNTTPGSSGWEGLGVVFFVTGPGLGLIMYIYLNDTRIS